MLFDRDCGFCRWSLQWIQKWDGQGRLDYLPIQSEEGARLLAAVPGDVWLDSWHFVAVDGEVSSAGDAFGPLLRQLPRGRRLARLSEVSPGLTDRAYRLVARNRTPLGKLVRRFGSVPPV